MIAPDAEQKYSDFAPISLDSIAIKLSAEDL
jgi:hypothetical protein